jgi:hypothetical protein
MQPLSSLLLRVRDRAPIVGVTWELARMAASCPEYLATGRTPERAYMSLRRLFSLTDGRFNDAVSSVLRVVRPAYELDSTTGVLGRMEGHALESVVRDLDRDGFHIFEARLPPEDCRQVRDFAQRVPCYPRRGDAEGPPVTFAPGNTSEPVFDFRPSELLTEEPLQRLVVDRSILAVAQAYLRCRVVLDLITMWWSTPGSGRATSEAAQLFHFDMDRIKFLKFFVLLTDVTPETGPHVYVRGSHRRKPPALRADGRRSDDEIGAAYGDRVVEIGGPAGTIFAADTRGFHKGLSLLSGTRLLFQLEFANSLFGRNYPRVSVPEGQAPVMRETMARFPFTFSNFDLPAGSG